MVGANSANLAGIRTDCVVAVVATLANGRIQVGSGYIVADRLVLTAEHCTRDKNSDEPSQPPVSLHVVRLSDRARSPAAITTVDEQPAASRALDIALLRIYEPSWPASSLISVGRINRQGPWVLDPCEAVGFPLWQLDPNDHTRNPVHFRGPIRAIDDLGSSPARLVLRDPVLQTVSLGSATPPAEAVTPADAKRVGRSAWGGVSGALVFYGGTAIGVVVEHNSQQGDTALRIRPLETLSAADDPAAVAIVKRLGLPDLNDWPVVTGDERPNVGHYGIDMVGGAAHTGLHASQIRLLQQVMVRGLPETGGAFKTQIVAALTQSGAARGPGEGVITVEQLGHAIAMGFRSGRAEAVLAVLRSAAVTGGSKDALFVEEVQLCWKRQLRIAPLVPPLETTTRKQVRYAHALAVPAGARVVVHTLVEALDHAAQHLRPATGLAPLDLLVALLEHQIGVRIVDSWFELDLQELSMLRAEAAHRLEVSRSGARLVVDFRNAAAGTPATIWPDTASCRLLLAGAWSEEEPVPCGPEDADAIAAVEYAVQWAGDQVPAFTVGLIVPRLLQNRIPEAWPIREEEDERARPLGFLHPVVLHSAERMTARGRRRTSWTQRLATIRTEPVTLDVEWLAAEASDPDAILVQVERSQATCIGVGFTPGPAVQPLGQDPLMAIVNGGAPYIAWFETEPADWPEARKQAEWVVAGGELSGAADRLWYLRRPEKAHAHVSRDAAADIIGTGLRMLWDDDTELPRAAVLRGEQTLATTAAASPTAAPGGP
jgi:hypothetical protein